jgi:predicted AAA+ superfamily ATPase
MERAQEKAILHDLNTKIVLLVGPRQVGKTWLAKHIAQQFQASSYLNYDQSFDRQIIHNQSWLPSTELLIIHELNKMKEWKNYLKGIFDTKPASLKLLVTGSARLDFFDHMGDSLAGRYFRHRLLPISMSEIKQTGGQYPLQRLLDRGGFPEPFFAANTTDVLRWRAQYLNSLLSTDAFELEPIKNLNAMRLLVEMLQHKVCSSVSYDSLSEDLNISPITVKRYIEVLESLYVIFRLTPYSNNIARSLLKEPKIYFFDTGLVPDNVDQKFENLMAVSLLKHVYVLSDCQGKPYKLHYLKTKEGQEVDFAIVNGHTIEHIIEAKTSNTGISKALAFFHHKYGLKATQVVLTSQSAYQHLGISIIPAEPFLEDLAL